MTTTTGVVIAVYRAGRAALRGANCIIEGGESVLARPLAVVLVRLTASNDGGISTAPFAPTAMVKIPR